MPQGLARGGPEAKISRPRSCKPAKLIASDLPNSCYCGLHYVGEPPLGHPPWTVIAVRNQKGGSGMNSMAIDLSGDFAARDMAVLPVRPGLQGQRLGPSSILPALSPHSHSRRAAGLARGGQEAQIPRPRSCTAAGCSDTFLPL